jgi:Protein of unknown function (DUF2905)
LHDARINNTVWDGLGKSLIVIGLLLAGVGVLFLLGARAGLGDVFSWFGRLPGDIIIKRENFSFYFPLTTSILMSVVLSLLLFVISLLSRH